MKTQRSSRWVNWPRRFRRSLVVKARSVLDPKELRAKVAILDWAQRFWKAAKALLRRIELYELKELVMKERESFMAEQF